jgi:hypothetical protein
MSREERKMQRILEQFAAMEEREKKKNHFSLSLSLRSVLLPETESSCVVG